MNKPTPNKPGRHAWVTALKNGGQVLKTCKHARCSWEMLSRKNSNRYRSGPTRPWMHTPKPCRGAR